MQPGLPPPVGVGRATAMRLRNWIVPVSLIAVLAVVGMDNFLLFHVLAELFAVIVAALLFAVA